MRRNPYLLVYMSLELELNFPILEAVAVYAQYVKSQVNFYGTHYVDSDTLKNMDL